LDPRLWRASAAVRRYLLASIACGVVIAGCAIGSAVVLGHLVAGVITDPAARSLGHWRTELAILVTLWVIRTLTRWVQGRLGQRGPSAVIADLSGQALHAVTALPPSLHSSRRGDAATVVTTSNRR
jgi:ATP-binding cassette, subfamily C, bacterial CydD